MVEENKEITCVKSFGITARYNASVSSLFLTDDKASRGI